jgi:hypothetical protein
MSKPKNKIREVNINWKTGDITFYFEGSKEPWGSNEFDPESLTRSRLKRIESHITAMLVQIELEDKAIARFLGKKG